MQEIWESLYLESPSVDKIFTSDGDVELKAGLVIVDQLDSLRAPVDSVGHRPN